MLKEIGLATSLIGGVFDLVKSGFKGKAEESASGAFGALMAGQTGVDIKTFETQQPDEMAGIADRMGADVAEALSMLREMTEGGLEGAMRWAMKKLEEEVMESMGITKDELATMPAEERMAMEKMIEDEVQRRLAESMGHLRQDMANGTISPEEMVIGIRNMLQAEANKAYRNELKIV